MTGNTTAISQHFADDVRRGLTAQSKYIPCVWFYDDRGSQLFEEICRQPEYYLTRAENEILEAHSTDIAGLFHERTVLVELGSGNSMKTRHLIEAFLGRHGSAWYLPIDVSEAALAASTAELHSRYPDLMIQPVFARYDEGLACIRATNPGPRLVLWLGGSIGNLSRVEAAAFLKDIYQGLERTDHILIGIDLSKDKSSLEAAYNDAAGVTAQFNLNLLYRINRELGADFDLQTFTHRAVYNEDEGRIEMYLRSETKQTIRINDLNLDVMFNEGECISTENSFKYTLEQINSLAQNIGCQLPQRWLDSKGRFSVNLFTANGK